MNSSLESFNNGQQAPADAINKAAISHSFSNSAASYDSGAALQRRVGNQLLSRLDKANTLLDLGTGPGYFTSALHDKSEQLIGLDIAPNMLRFARDRNKQLRVTWLAGDAEKLPLTDRSVNSIYSSLMLQWVHQLSKALEEAYRVLDDGGQFVFSTLLDGTLFELAQSWTAVDDAQHVNTFLRKSELAKIIANSEFELQALDVQPQIIYYSSVLALMRDLKAIGANQTANHSQGLMGRGALKKLAQEYELFRTSDGLTATYQVAFCTLVKSI